MNYSKSTFQVLFLPLLSVVFSCKTMYAPDMQLVPMLEKKGDIHATLNFTNLQIAWAPFHKVGVFVNGYYKNKELLHLDDGKTYNYRVNSYAFQGGIGSFWYFDNRWVEVYAGGGKGYGDLKFGISPRGFGGSSSHYNKVFIQPVIGIGNEKWKYGFSIRASFLNFYDFVEYSGNTIASTSPFFIEPCFTLSRSIDWFSVKGQLQYSLASEDVSNSYYMPYGNMLVGTLAIAADLDQLFKSRKEK